MTLIGWRLRIWCPATALGVVLVVVGLIDYGHGVNHVVGVVAAPAQGDRKPAGLDMDNVVVVVGKPAQANKKAEGQIAELQQPAEQVDVWRSLRGPVTVGLGLLIVSFSVSFVVCGRTELKA